MEQNNNLPVYKNNEGGLPTGFENADTSTASNITFPTKLITDKDDHANFYILKRSPLGMTEKDENGKAIRAIFCPSKVKIIVIGVARGIQLFEGSSPTYAYANSKSAEKKAIYDKYNFNRDKPQGVEEIEDLVGYLIDPQPTGKPELVYVQLKRTSIYKNRRYANFFIENKVPTYSMVTTVEVKEQISKSGQKYYIPILGIDTNTTIEPGLQEKAIDAAIRFSKIEGPGLVKDLSNINQSIDYNSDNLGDENTSAPTAFVDPFAQTNEALMKAADEVVI